MHRAKMQKTSYHLCNRSSCKNAKVANRNYAKKKNVKEIVCQGATVKVKT